MRIPFPALGLAGAFLLSAAAAADSTPLFNGRDLTGWEFVAMPAQAITSVRTAMPDGVVAAQGKPAGFIAAARPRGGSDRLPIRRHAIRGAAGQLGPA